MKNFIMVITGVVLLFLGYFALYDFNRTHGNAEPTADQIKEKAIVKKLEGMSLEEKIGQMLIINYTSKVYDQTLAATVKITQPGGFIIFKDNVDSYTQLTILINSMQSDSKIPMLISTDQEGGLVQRIKNLTDVDATIIPAMQYVGNMNDKNLAYKVGTVIGEELDAFGINTDYAPVLDINSNPNNTVIGNRSFGNNYSLVSKMGLSVAKGISDSNVIPVFKHFPGHGDTGEDPHYALPISNKTKRELYQLELKPFIDAIKNNASMIMIGHIAFPNITGDNTPASLSSKIVKDLLIDELGFSGVVVTDALNMRALVDNYTSDEILIKAINAGVDMLLMPVEAIASVETIKESLEDGKISEAQINRSVKKILMMKYEAGFFEEQTLKDKSVIGSPSHKNIINSITR